jgi:hypothetical protein
VIRPLLFNPADEIFSVSLYTNMQGHWAAATVSKLAALGIVSGYPDGTFKTENENTRAEVTAILARTLKLAPGKEEELKFKDSAVILVWARGAWRRQQRRVWSGAIRNQTA